MLQEKKTMKEKAKDQVSEFLDLRFNLSWELGVLLASWFLVVGGLYLAFQVVTTERVALNFILYGPVSLLLLGTLVPLLYVSQVKEDSLDTIGVTREYWLISIGIGIVLGANTYVNTLANIQLPAQENLIPLIAMALTVGLFEALFFRGWMQLGFERAFGAIPAVVLGAAFYALYHIGYGMDLGEMWFLFKLGIQFALAFRLTKNILVLWPFYTWIGGMYSNIEDGLIMPFEATYGFVIILGLMIGSILVTYARKVRRNKSKKIMPNKEEKHKQPIETNTLTHFLILTFGLTWGIAAILISFPKQIIAIFGEIGLSNPLIILAVYSPGFAGIFLVWRKYGLKGLGSFLRRLSLWRAPLQWWVFLILGIPAIVYAGAFIKGSINDPFSLSLSQALPALLLALFLGPIEEFGWRGLALPLMQRKLSPFWAALALGGIWSLWHVPSFLISGMPQTGWSAGPYFLGIIALSLIMTPLFNKSKGSLLISMLFHFNVMNPIWPDAQPWDNLLYIVFSVMVVFWNRHTMFKRGSGITEILYHYRERNVA